MDFFDMLNGSTYPCLVKDFWVRVEVYNEGAIAFEESHKITRNEDLKGKSRVEMGLDEFKEVKIRFVVIGVDDIGRCALNTKDDILESSLIKELLFFNKGGFGKVKNMKTEYRLLFKISLGTRDRCFDAVGE